MANNSKASNTNDNNMVNNTVCIPNNRSHTTNYNTVNGMGDNMVLC